VTDTGARLLAVRETERGLLVVIDRGGATETYEVAKEALAARLPGIGQRVGDELLTEIQAAAERKRAARRAFALLDRRLRSLAELERILVAERFDPAAVAAVLKTFRETGLHDDRRFAAAFCRDALRRKPVGRIWLSAKLRERGIDPAVIAETVLAELPEEREAQLAREAATRRWLREGGSRDRRSEARVARFLAGRGFPTGLCREVARRTRPPAPDGDDGEPESDCEVDS
jgi:SOS response regulatory protein OraA/RecX